MGSGEVHLTGKAAQLRIGHASSAKRRPPYRIVPANTRCGAASRRLNTGLLYADRERPGRAGAHH